jgi:predicted RNA-binding Zn-ribbon protein involved in translation (DUF1610 family)
VDVTTALPAKCLTCGYDLSTVHGDRAPCPECGEEFVRSAHARRRHAAITCSLTLISFGALGVVGASALAAAIAFLPRPSEGSAGDGAAAGMLLVLLPSAALAYGTALLGGATGITSARRRWPAVVAGVFALCVIFRGATGSWWGWADYSPWLQAQQWRMIAEWVLVFADGLVVIAAGAAVRRLAGRTGGASMAKFLRVVMVGAGAASGFHFLSKIYAIYLESRSGSGGGLSPFSGSQPPVPFLHSGVMLETLDAASAVAWWFAWVALGLVALHARALWRASE